MEWENFFRFSAAIFRICLCTKSSRLELAQVRKRECSPLPRLPFQGNQSGFGLRIQISQVRESIVVLFLIGCPYRCIYSQ